MEHILPQANFNFFTVFFWHVAFVYLIVQIILSFIIYQNNKDNVFRVYCLYVLLLFTYIVCRNYYFLDFLTYKPIYLYSYYIQVIYLCVYFHFGLTLINFRLHHPKFTKSIYRFMVVAVSTGTILFVATLADWIHPSFMPEYYFNIFFPVYISLAIFILVRAAMLNKHGEYTYFLIGSFAFLILGALAVITSRSDYSPLPIDRIAYFYLAIIAECTFFGIGLGIRVQDTYHSKLETERKLNVAQKELQMRLERHIEKQEEDKLELKKEKELQTLATQIALLENKVLRSQMNSHFIFNVLNSIKAYIIEQDVTKAVSYLNKFSKLMRHVLEASRSEKYSLEEEINAIKIYLDIEKVRISDDFTYVVNITSSQRLKNVYFPALLIQPFVENAIWHGLLHADRSKELSINLYDDGLDIVIDIIDNGVGYTHSLQKKTTSVSHRSHGMNITRERIEQFNKKNQSTISFQVSDRIDTQGTIVKIRIEKIV